MKNRIRDDITCATASSECRGRKRNLMGQMKEVGDYAKLGHIPVGKTKALKETCQEDWLTLNFIKNN